MSDKEDGEFTPEKPFHIDRAKTGRASCKKCKQKIAKEELRFAKLATNPFGSGTIKQWHHIACIFEVFKKQRASTKKLEHPDDLGGWEKLSENDKEEFMAFLSPEVQKVFKSSLDSANQTQKIPENIEDNKKKLQHKYNSFKTFRKLCADIANNTSYLAKTKIIAEFFDKILLENECKNDIELLCRLLLSNAILRVYNLQSKQLIKLFSRILETNQEEMLEDLEKGDVAETISVFFNKSKAIRKADKSTLTIQDVDKFLDELSEMTKEDEQIHHFKKIAKKCKVNDLKMILRLVKHDLRINAGPKHVLEALHKDAYEAFQTSRDIKSVVANALKARKRNSKDTMSKNGMDIDITMMTPVLPMLAQPCKSVQMALEKCPNGMYSEVKYDGERVQLHKEGDIFKYYSRSLKPVLPHKVNHFKNYIPKAFPFAKNLILDAEILMVDSKTGRPLPFGTLGIHKKNEFKDANVCLFVFDCIYYNGKSLLKVPLSQRKDILKNNMVEIKNRIMFSEMEIIYKASELEKMMTKIFKLGLEGLVLKDLNSMYEPGKRHWFKMKKDYLEDGAMADSADLVVLGAWFGTGSKGGIMSSFLMGCNNPATQKWLTVTKVSNGLDDETLDRIQKELDVVKISKDQSKVPNWLKCTKTMIPDFVASDPKRMPVWEITGAEFTCNQVHTADGISIRFPRVTKIRKDKDWSTATTLNELKELYERSKNTSDFTLNPSKSSSSTDLDSPEKDDISKKSKRRKTQCDSVKPDKIKKQKLMKEDENVCYGDTEMDDCDLETAEIKSEIAESDLPKPLPNIFTNCVVQLPKDYKHHNFLRRYLIAYDARLHDPSRNTNLENPELKVTHVIHLTKSTAKQNEKFWSEKVRHVHIDWIWNSIKLLKRQPESGYVVTVKEEV